MEYLELESERLLFRKYAKEDFPVFYDMLSNLENMKYRSSEPKGMEAVQKYLDWGMKCAEQSPCINFRYAVVLKETGEVIGSCELAYTNKDPAELAWELHRNYWRKGYGTEIGKTLLKLGFETLGLRRIIADCNTLNKGSYGIMEKIGMRREAHYVKYYRGNSALNHEWCDKYLYAILSEEYFGRVAGACEKEIEFKKFTDFNRGIMYEILKDAYSFDERCAICWDENWKQSDAFFFDNPDIADKYGFVTCYRGEPIGFICWDPRNRPEYVEIGHNGIRTKYKGKGFGKAQLSEALRRIKEYTGLKEIRVWTNSNLIAPRNYESVGFVLYDTKENNDEAVFSGDYLYYKIKL